MKFIQILGIGAALFTNLAEAHWLSEEQIREEFTPYDIDMDGQISASQLDRATRDQLKQFEDPYVSAEEMTAFVNDIVGSIMKSDTNGDGFLDFEQYSVMLRAEHETAGQREKQFNERMAKEQAQQSQQFEEDFAQQEQATEGEAAEQQAEAQQENAEQLDL